MVPLGLKRNMKAPTRILFALALAWPAGAQFNGHNLLGDFGLMAGSQAPPGFYAGYLTARYSTDTLRGPQGGTLPGSGERSLETYAHMGVVNWVLDKKVLGANIGGMAAFPVMNLAIDFPGLDFGPQEFGYADTYVQPINLGWKTSRADAIVGYGFSAPNGRYEPGGDGNRGRGFWSHEFSLGSTVYFNEARTWHVATTGFYETHTRRKGDDVRVGDTLTLEGGLGKTVMQIINVGAAYYAHWKVTTDDVPRIDELPENIGGIAQDIIGTKHRVYGVGPEFSIFLPTKMDGNNVESGLNFVVRYFWETGAINKTEGRSFLFSLMYLL